MAVYQIDQKEPAPLAPSTSDSSIISDNGDMRISFVSTETGNAVEFRNSDGQFVRYVPQEIKYIDRSTGLEDVLCDADSSVTAFVVRGNQVFFDRHFDGVTESWTIEAGQLKHNLTLNLPQRAPAEWIAEPWLAVAGSLECSADLHVRDMVDQLDTDGAIHIIDASGRVAFTFPPIEVWDQGNGKTGGLYTITPFDASRFQLTTSVDNSWLSDSSRQYPVVIDPTVVSASPAALSNGGDGKKIVELSDGTLISGAFLYALSSYTTVTNQVQLFKSTDKGLTWTTFGSPTPALYSCIDFSIDIDSSNNIYLFYTGYPSYQGCGNLYLDIFSPTGTRTLTSKLVYSVATGGWTTALPAGTSVTGKVCAGVVYAGFSIPANRTFCNTYVLKSSDGCNTWGTILSQVGMSGYYYTSICLIPDNNGNLHIGYFYNCGLYYAKYTSAGNLTTPIQIFVPTQNGIYVGLSGLIDNNGYVHWFSWMQETYTTASDYTNGKSAIWEHLSKDGGTSWTHSVAMNPAFNVYAPTSALDPRTNDIYLFAHGIDPAVSSTYNNLVRAVKSGSTATWGSTTTITNNTTSDAKNASALWEMFNNNSPDAIRYIWADGAGVEYNSISLNVAPLAPTLTPHANFDATTPQTLAWTFNDVFGDTQSAFQLQLVDVATGNTIFDTGKQASTTQSYNLAANTLTNGKQYQWRVNTWDSYGAQGTYSNYSTFFTAVPPTVSITSPGTDGYTVAIGTVTPQWSYSDPLGNVQQTYQVQLTDTNNVILWDSGQKTSSTANALTIGYTLANNTTYKIKVTVTNSKGITSSTAVRTFVTSFTPPAVPTLILTPNNGYIGLVVTNPVPTGTQPAVSNNDLFRRKQGDSAWTRIATNLATNVTYNDYHVRSDTVYEYKVTATGTNVTSSDSAISSTSLTLAGIWLHDPTSPATTVKQFLLFDRGRSGNYKQNASLEQFAGRKLPVPFFGIDAERSIQFKLNMTNTADMDTLRSLVERNSTLCYRDARGRKCFGVIRSLPDVDEWFGASASITFECVDFSEVV